ncbi:MAG: glycosyltransferase [Candidatus Binatia bacterium]
MRILELHAPYFRDAWRQAGHEVVCWGPYPHCDLRAPEAVVSLPEVLAALPSGWAPDAILLGDDSRSLLVLGLEDAPCPTVLLSVDTHHHAWWHAPLAAAHDVAFVAQKEFLDGFVAAGVPDACWLPLWAPDDVAAPQRVPAHAVAFVGSLDPTLHPERVAFLRAVGARLPLTAQQGDWRSVFGASRIVLNQTIKGDLNFRVFEALASGAMLLTERTGNGLLELFGDGEHLVTYPRGDVDAAAALAARYLADEPARARIAARGRHAVLAAHCEMHRAATVVAALAAGPVRRPDAVRVAGAARAYALLAFRARRAIEMLGDTPFYRGLRSSYLAAALRLTTDRRLGEPHRSGVLGLVMAEQGDRVAALEHLGRAVAGGAPIDDHLLRIEMLIEQGDVRAARAALERLVAAHPGYELGGAFAAALGEAVGVAR